MAKRAFLICILLLFLIVGLLPVLSMLFKSVTVEGHLDLTSYKGLLTSRRQWILMGHSLLLSSLVTALVTAIGLPMGILFGKTDLPFRRFFTVLFVVPLLIPPYIIAVSWFDFLGREGLLAQVFGSSIGELTAHYFSGLAACVVVLFSTFLPISMLFTIIFLKTISILFMITT